MDRKSHHLERTNAVNGNDREGVILDFLLIPMPNETPSREEMIKEIYKIMWDYTTCYDCSKDWIIVFQDCYYENILIGTVMSRIERMNAKQKSTYSNMKGRITNSYVEDHLIQYTILHREEKRKPIQDQLYSCVEFIWSFCKQP